MSVAEPVEAIRAINDRQVFLTACLLVSGLLLIDNQYVRNSCQSIWNGRNLYHVYHEIVANHAVLLEVISPMIRSKTIGKTELINFTFAT